MDGTYNVFTWYIPCIYRSGCDIPCIYQEYTWYIPRGIYHVYTWYIPCILCIFLVYTKYIHNICLSMLMNDIPSTSDHKAWRHWKTSLKISVDLGLCCHRVTFTLIINCNMMPDWCLYDHQSNVMRITWAQQT